MFADPRTEWRINDIERGLNEKATHYEVSAMRSDVDRLDCTVRELSALVDGLRNELEASKNHTERLEQMIIDKFV